MIWISTVTLQMFIYCLSMRIKNKVQSRNFTNIAFLFAFISWHLSNEKALKLKEKITKLLPVAQHGEFLLVEANILFVPTTLVAPTPEVATCRAWLSQCRSFGSKAPVFAKSTSVGLKPLVWARTGCPPVAQSSTQKAK